MTVGLSAGTDTKYLTVTGEVFASPVWLLGIHYVSTSASEDQLVFWDGGLLGHKEIELRILPNSSNYISINSGLLFTQDMYVEIPIGVTATIIYSLGS